MNSREYREYSLTKHTGKLQKLICKYPDHYICVLAGENASIGDGWTFCSDITNSVGKILDTEYYDYDDKVITTKKKLREVIEDRCFDRDMNDEEIDAAVEAKLKELEPYWKDVIFICADN